jgi:hypothetical protein
MHLLEVSHLRKSSGSLFAVDDLSFHTRPAGAAPATPINHRLSPINHGLRPLGHETFATAALGLFLPIEQSGITSGLSHDRQPEHFARYGRRNSL